MSGWIQDEDGKEEGRDREGRKDRDVVCSLVEEEEEGTAIRFDIESASERAKRRRKRGSKVRENRSFRLLGLREERKEGGDERTDPLSA